MRRLIGRKGRTAGEQKKDEGRAQGRLVHGEVIWRSASIRSDIRVQYRQYRVWPEQHASEIS
jgi:hypothetical protein